uniref:Seipin n=1 Tax=Coturnix japonica TaxID=93934 RepID=A0A8C2SMM3_COTJA
MLPLDAPWPRVVLLWFRRCSIRLALFGAGSVLLLWAAAFAYGVFYFLTVPATGLVAPVHFRFR